MWGRSVWVGTGVCIGVEVARKDRRRVPLTHQKAFMLSDVFHGTVMRIQQNHGGS